MGRVSADPAFESSSSSAALSSDARPDLSDPVLSEEEFIDILERDGWYSVLGDNGESW